MIQVINGEIKQYRLPKAGTLKDGRTVSGYNLLGEDILRAEGWLPYGLLFPSQYVDYEKVR